MTTKKKTSSSRKKSPVTKATAARATNVIIWIYSENMGDGAVVPRIFNSESDAQTYAKAHTGRFCDDIVSQKLSIHPDKNEILNPTPIMGSV